MPVSYTHLDVYKRQVDSHRSRRFFGNGMFDDGLDRCKTSARSDQQHRLCGILTQVETAMRPVDTQNVALLHGVEHMIGKLAARHMPDMQLLSLIHI